MTDEIKELKKQVEELKKENTELQRELSVHNFLDTGVPQERLDYQRELKKEIIRLKSLNRRAADEIRDLDDIIIRLHNKFPEVREFLGWEDDDLWAGESSINLLNRLDGKTNGGYIENYEDLHLEMKTLDGYAQIEHPDFYVSKNVREHNLQMLQEVAELTKLYSEGKYFQFLEGTKDLIPEQLVEVAPLLKPAMQKLRKQDDPDFYQNHEHPPECKWHKDWHACDCGYFDKSDKHNEEDWKCPTCGDPDFNCHHDED